MNLPAPVRQSGPEKPKKSGMSKFLAILNCCKVPEDSHTQPVESPEAARKVERPSQSTQSTPPQKADIGLSEKDLADEKRTPPEATVPTAADTTFPKSALTTNDKKIPGAVRTDDAVSDNKATASIPSEVLAQPTEKSRMDKPLPASPKTEEASKDVVAAAAGAAGAASLAAVGVTGATKLSGGQPSEKSACEETKPLSEEQVISDRTPEQARKDEDIEMSDVPPSIPIASNEVGVTKESGGAPVPGTQPNVPPAPPVPIPPPNAQNPQGPVPTSEAPTLPEAQLQESDRKWLLPTIRPELKGKKCLVLDLDETLVHSSFKVCFITIRITGGDC